MSEYEQYLEERLTQIESMAKELESRVVRLEERVLERKVDVGQREEHQYPEDYRGFTR